MYEYGIFQRAPRRSEADQIFTIMESIKNSLSSFTFIPRLTKNRQKKKKDISGIDNPELRKIFNRLISDSTTQGYFQEIQQYFFQENSAWKYQMTLFPMQPGTNMSILFHAKLPINSLIFLGPGYWIN